jgi:hypothetical protein
MATEVAGMPESRRVQKVEIKLKTKQADLRVLRNFQKYPTRG